MKNLFLIASLVFTLVLNAQDDSTFKKFKVGMRWGLGYNFNNFSGQPSMIIDYLTPLNGGLVFEYRVSSLFSIQPEVQYTNFGLREYADSTKSKHVTLDINYLSLNMLAKIRMEDDKEKFGLYAIAGPSINYFLSSKISASKGVLNIPSNEINSAFDKFNISLIFGLGATYKINERFELFGDLRANASIRNSFETIRVDNKPLILNQFSLSLGGLYSF